MKTIIQHIVTEAVEKYLKFCEEKGIVSISVMTEAFKAISDEMAKEMLQAFIDGADDAICEAKAERKADEIKVHEKKVPRTVFTALGSFTYRRTYFNLPHGRSYILDNILEVSSYERIDAGVSAQLVNLSAQHSYGRSADIGTGGQISRQSVKNKVMNTGELSYIPEKAKNTPEALHIFADEDHVNLQNGKNTIVPLITVCEGKSSICKGRNKLIAPFHVHGYGIKPDTYWEYVFALCASRYDMSKVKRIYIYSDAAEWIAKFKNVFPNAIHVLDRFHFKKRCKSLFSGKICSTFNLDAHRAIRNDDKANFSRIMQNMLYEVFEKMPVSEERENKLKRITENASYIINHWEAIQNMKHPGSIGSSTEAMVSHVLSARLSRNPMGWSKEGLSKMSMIRVFVINGGKIEPADTLAWKQNPDKDSMIETYEKYDDIVRKQQDAILEGAKHWRWFETDELISGKTTGTKVALNALGTLKKVS
jgi:hypothetical protein